MAVTQAETKNEKHLKRNEEKWTVPLMVAGWTVLPSIILEKQHAFGLDAIDINILMHLARHWWFSDNLPYPSKAELATCMNVDASTIRRHIARMEAEGFIKREARYTKRKFGGQDTNRYSFEGLIKQATPHAEEAIALRERQRAENAARKSRKKPTLVVDNTAK